MSNEASSGTSRGEFLKRTAGATGLVVGAGVWTRGALAAPQADPAEVVIDPTAALAPTSRSFASGHFALELEGASVGILKSVAGGDTFAEVISEQSAGSYYSHKHITSPEYEDFTIRCGLTMGESFFDWVADSWEGSNERKDGAIVAADFQNDVKSRREFFDALISETTIPALDGASNDVVYLTVSFSPEFAQSVPGNGTLTVPAVQKLWQSANFKLEIDGLDTSRVAKIDAFTIKQQFLPDQIGEVRDPVRQPGKVEFPNLTITLSAVGAESWYEWFDDFVIQGSNSQADERDGTLRFLSPSLKDELGQVRFFNLGIFKLAPATMEAGAVTRLVAELYCERMELGIA